VAGSAAGSSAGSSVPTWRSDVPVRQARLVPSRRLSCCFCGGRTSDVPATDYVELAARFPEIDSSMIQFFGAHAACFDRVNAHGYRLERPLVEAD
jgi:hypothetical protein